MDEPIYLKLVSINDKSKYSLLKLEGSCSFDVSCLLLNQRYGKHIQGKKFVASCILSSDGREVARLKIT